MLVSLRAGYRRHRPFVLLLILFVAFRVLALLLFRPGGFITDFSDFDFYATWGQLVPMGYTVYDNLWTAYPPLFPALMLRIFELSSRIPPWIEPRLAFHVLLGLVLLLFETGNLVLIYRLALHLAGQSVGETDVVSTPQVQTGPSSMLLSPAQPVTAPLLYALLFVPVYTLTGWFEAMPLFLMLLGLDLLITRLWAASAVASALGFLTKLTPILLLPIAIRYLGARLQWQAMRHEWFNRRHAGSLLRPFLYGLIFVLMVVAAGYHFVRANPDLMLSSFRVQSIRPPWQSVWALMDNFYGYGLVPLDMRNLSGLHGSLWETTLPWGWIGLAFVLVYLWLYTRSYDWSQPRTPIAFSAVSVLLLFLYSKGWSPQFLLWVLAFVVLLLPTMRGICVAILLSLVNFVEANVFLILLPEEHWIMWGTVLVRSALLILLLVEFAGQIWPKSAVGYSLRRGGAVLTWAVCVLAVIGAVIGAPRAAQAYAERRLAEHPCADAISFLRESLPAPQPLIISQQPEVWRDLYPWLRKQYAIHLLDGYTPAGDPGDVTLAQANRLTAARELWWIERNDTGFSGTSPQEVRERFLAQPQTHLLAEHTFGACHLYQMVHLPDRASLAQVEVAGGPIQLMHAIWQFTPKVAGGNSSLKGVEDSAEHAKMGEGLQVVLYWLADTPVEHSYTVFTQLFDQNGEMIAQQDNLPVNGLAPTDTWQPGTPVRDAYFLPIPSTAQRNALELWIGMYRDLERRPVTLPNGTSADHLSLPLAELAD